MVKLRLQGLYQDRPKLPFVPGSEVSGMVIEVGRDVRTVAVGDSVRLPLVLVWNGNSASTAELACFLKGAVECTPSEGRQGLLFSCTPLPNRGAWFCVLRSHAWLL